MSMNQEKTSLFLSQNESQDMKQHFIDDEKFQLLKQCQQRILEATQVSPTLRKLVNELMTTENLDKVITKYLTVLND